LFATHYHELAELERVLPRVRNYRMDVLEEGDRVVFLHRVVPGSAGRSYGIHVARLAGVPRTVTQRAEAVLADLEARRQAMAGTPGAAGPSALPVSNGFASRVVPARRGGRSSSGAADAVASAAASTVTTLQLTLFGPAEPHPVVEELKALDVMAMTPLEALNRLAQLVDAARRSSGH
ncbi:MAG TPA: DNA mismatch repair protein MutS, partial [Chloroflexota bacterium]|nr:DNA mismatch repair protein MutS [Chloroflexota bacterium]